MINAEGSRTAQRSSAPRTGANKTAHVAQLGERLIASGYISRQQCDAAIRYQRMRGGLLGEALVNLGIISEQRLNDFFNKSPVSLSGERLVQAGIVTGSQLTLALDFQEENGGRLGNVIVALGFATQKAVDSFYLSEEQKAPRRMGEMLVQSGVITGEQLESALLFQKNSGGQLGEILIALGYVSEDRFYKALATQMRVGRVGNKLNFSESHKLPYAMAYKYTAIIINSRPDEYILAVRDILDKKALADIGRYLDRPVEQVLATISEIENFWEYVYQYEESRESLYGLYEKQPMNSAILTFSRGQKIVFILMMITLALMLMFNYTLAFLIVNAVLQILYAFFTIFKAILLSKGFIARNPLRFTEEELAAIDERELPVYTLLIPIYREAEVIGNLVRNLMNIDYPKHKLDVRIMLEEDDGETLAALNAISLPSYFTVIVVPDTQPHTKPKACNYGLIHARGDYVVIYDAEDMPEPDQLKKAFLAFKRLPESFVCVQCQLNYYNNDQNTLTRWFTQEYSTWFDSLLVGIMDVEMPIPLGGTSNHFKTSILREIGAWDPFNVTEDADLGVRLHKLNYKTAIIDSRTWEEANSNIKNWIKQRSHWIKGYMQTWLVHMRQPGKLYKELGFKGFVGYQTMVLGTWLTPLLNPIFWALLIIWFAFEPAFMQHMFPGVLYLLAALLLIVGNFIFAYTNIAGSYMTVRESEITGVMYIKYTVVLSGILFPIYWLLMSIAGYRALFQLVAKPHYWEKTRHGLTEQTTLDGITAKKG